MQLLFFRTKSSKIAQVPILSYLPPSALEQSNTANINTGLYHLSEFKWDESNLSSITEINWVPF